MGRPGTSCAGTPSCWRSPPRPPIWTTGVPAPEPSRVLLLPEDILVGDADLKLSGFDSGQCSMPNAIRAVSPRTEEPQKSCWIDPTAAHVSRREFGKDERASLKDERHPSDHLELGALHIDFHESDTVGSDALAREIRVESHCFYVDAGIAAACAGGAEAAALAGISSPQAVQRTRANPFARIPQPRERSNSPTTNLGRPGPPSLRSSISARKVFQCARTVACKSIRSGSRRRYARAAAASDDDDLVHAPSPTAPIRRRHDHEPGQANSRGCRWPKLDRGA